MRRKIYLPAILFSFVSFFVNKANAQEAGELPVVNIVSPTASSLGKYVDFPVNLHSGIPEVNIPIYTVQEGSLSLPISLSYHASGLLVPEIASWVGAGWSLHAGGVVSRAAKGGNPDERRAYQDNTFWAAHGFSNYFYTFSPEGDSLNDYPRFLSGHKDGEPDLYTFNFGSYSGKFYFREDRTPVLIPASDLKIELLLKAEGNISYDYFQGFKITDPNGVKYYFGVTEDPEDIDPIEKSRIMTNEVLETYMNVISSWYLYRIESPDGLFQINISYRSEGYGYYTISTKPCIPDSDGSVKAMKIGVSGVAIDEISFSNGRVKLISNNVRQDLSTNDFSATPIEAINTDAKSLDEIQIISNNSPHRLTYKLYYGYFHDRSEQELPYIITQGTRNFERDRKRLKLDSLQMFGADDITNIPPYIFYYYDTTKVPRRLSFGQDHWGYANGVTTNTTMIPPVSVDNGATYGTGDDREANWPAMRAGALHLIQTPTGGCTEYLYEPNNAITVNNCVPQQAASITSLQAGMGTPQAEFSTPYTLVVYTASFYYYDVYAYGSGATGVPGGKFYIDNSVVATVTYSNNPNEHDFIFLKPGTYTLKAYANADNGSGEGILAHFYQASASCDPPGEKMVGGLRIHRISKFGEKDSPKISMSYRYENSNLYSVPVYIIKMKNNTFKGLQELGGTEMGCLTGGHPSLVAYPSPISIQPLHTVQGYHIGYRTVKEIHQDGGYSVYEYKGNFDLPGNWHTLEDVCVRKVNVNVCTDEDPVYPSAPIPFDFERGRLKSQKIFTRNNKLVKEITNTEQHTETDVGIFGVVVGAYTYTIDQQTIVTTLPTHYDIRSVRLDWTKSIEKTFDDAGNSISTENTTYFNSPYHSMPSRKTRTSQHGNAQIDYLYVPDLTACDFDFTTSCRATYLAKAEELLTRYEMLSLNCTMGSCVESNFKGWDGPPGPCDNNRWYCKRIAYADYLFRLNLARIEYTNCIKGYKFLNAGCVKYGIVNYPDPGVRTLYQMNQKNLLKIVESTSWKENVFQSSTFYDYLAQPQDTSRIYLKNVYTTEVSTPVSTFTPAFITVAKVVERDPKYNADPMATYLFGGGQPVEIKNRNGSVTSYIWGFENTVPLVKADGVEHSVLINAYNASPANVRANVYSVQPTALVSTYTHEPIMGITSVTDANGLAVYYEYDTLGRLIRIRDHEQKVLEQYAYTYHID